MRWSAVRCLGVVSAFAVVLALAGAADARRAGGGAVGTWQFVAPLVDGGLSWHAVAASGDRVYSLGGIAGGECCSPEDYVAAYDIPTGVWAPVARLPRATYGLAATTAPDGRIFATGGYQQGDRLWVYDPARDSWADGPALPTARLFPGLGTGGDGRIYIIGGDADGPLTTADAFDPVTGVWDQLPPLPVPRRGAAVVPSDTGVYVVGGSGSDPFVGMRVDAYEPSTRRWVTLAPLRSGAPPLSAPVSAARAPDGRIVIIPAPDCLCPFPDPIELYDPQRGTSTLGPRLNVPRSYHAVAVGSDARLYVVGGVVYDHATNVVEALDLAPACTLLGTASADALEGTPQSDVLCALGADDSLRSGEGDDVLEAGRGDDSLAAGGGNDSLYAGAGDDLLAAGDGNDSLFAGAGADQARAGLGDDVLRGGAGRDLLLGGPGTDVLVGGPGADVLLAVDGVSGNDLLVGGGGRDVCEADPGDSIFGCT